MALNLAGLASYTDQNSGILIGRAILGADLLNYVNLQPGYSAGTVDINILNLSQMEFGTRACGWTDTGTVSYEKVSVTVRNRQSKQNLCLQDLRGYWLSANMGPSAFDETYPLEQFLADEAVKATRLNFEQILATDLYAGMTAGNGATLAGVGAGLTLSTIWDTVNLLIDNIPQSVRSRDDLYMYMSHNTYRNLCRRLVELNYFHYNAGQNTLGTGLGQNVIIPGTNITAVPVAGFGTSTRVVLGPKEHMVVVTGLTDDQDKISIWYSKDNDQIRMLSAYRAGIGAVYSSFVTNGTN